MARAYSLERRREASEQTRARILSGARALLSADGVSAFTIDAVAERAGVARMTVYYQFGSKRGLLEALFDSLAAIGLVERLRASFGRSEPFDALAEFIGAFVGFWASDRVVIRRVRSLAGLDADVEQSLRARDQKRREGLRVILGRLAESHGPAAGSLSEAVDMLHALTSFETFDALAGHGRNPEQVATLLIRLAHAFLRVDEAKRQAGRAPAASSK